MKTIDTPRAVRWSLMLAAILSIACGNSGGGSGDDKDAARPRLIGVSGGTFNLGGGIVLAVPRGALTTSVTVSVEALDPGSTQAVLDEGGNLARTLLAGASFAPDGLAFLLPVTVTLPLVQAPGDGMLPFHYKLDKTYNNYYPQDTNLTASAADGTVSFSLSEFSTHVVAGVTEIALAEGARPVSFSLTEFSTHLVAGVTEIALAEGARPSQKSWECNNPATACRCRRVRVVSEDDDRAIVKDDETCQASIVSGAATFLDCGGLVETWLFVEHTDACVPKLELTPEKTSLVPEETTALNARVTYAGAPLPGTQVNFSGEDTVGVVHFSGLTNAGGWTATTVVAGTEEGLGTVNGEALISYESEKISANGEIQELVVKEKQLFQTVVFAVDAPLGLEVKISPGRWGDYLVVDEETDVSVAIRVPVSVAPAGFLYHGGETVNLIASDGTVAATAITSSDGPVIARYKAPNAEGPITIEANATFDTTASNGETITQTLNHSATIDVLPGPVERWHGLFSMSVSAVLGTDNSLAQTSFEVLVEIPFEMQFELDLAPGTASSNITGGGEAFVTVNTYGPDQDCSTTSQPFYIEQINSYPFTAVVDGLAFRGGQDKRVEVGFGHAEGADTLLAEVTKITPNSACYTFLDLVEAYTVSLPMVFGSLEASTPEVPFPLPTEYVPINLTGRDAVLPGELQGVCFLHVERSYGSAPYICGWDLTMTRRGAPTP